MNSETLLYESWAFKNWHYIIKSTIVRLGTHSSRISPPGGKAYVPLELRIDADGLLLIASERIFRLFQLTKLPDPLSEDTFLIKGQFIP